MSCELYKKEPRKCLLRRAQARCTGTPSECSICERIPQMTPKEPLPMRKEPKEERTMAEEDKICRACGLPITKGQKTARGVHHRCYMVWYHMHPQPPFEDYLQQKEAERRGKTCMPVPDKKEIITPLPEGMKGSKFCGNSSDLIVADELVVDGVPFTLVTQETREPAISIGKDGINILAGARKAFELDAYDYVLVGTSGNKIAVKFLSQEHPQARKLCKHVSKMQICARAVRKQFKQRGPFTLVATDQADTFVAEVG